MLTVPATSIPIPSDFHITVSSVTDSEGNAIDVTQTYIAFRFFIGDVSHYCISDPLNNNFKNAAIRNGVLYLIFGRHPFRKPGKIKYVQEDRNTNTLYTDGYQNVFSSVQESAITLV